MSNPKAASHHHTITPALLLLLLLSLAVAGCSLTQKSNVPGVTNDFHKVTKMDPVPISHVISAVQIQLGDAFAYVATEKAKVRGNSPAEKEEAEAWNNLKLQSGSGVFSGETQLVQTDSGGISAVIPFTGYAGSTLTPNLDISSSATGIQNTTLTFSFEPQVATTGLPALNAGDAGIEVGGYITKCVKSAFEQIAKRRSYVGAPITEKQLDVSVTFSVVRTGNAGLGIVIVPTTPSVTSISTSPALGVSRQTMGTYKLDLTIPLVTGDTADPKRIIDGTVDLQTGRVRLIDRPFDMRTYDIIRGPARAAINVPYVEEEHAR